MDELKKLRRIVAVKKIFIDFDIEMVIRTKGNIDTIFDVIKAIVNEGE